MPPIEYWSGHGLTGRTTCAAPAIGRQNTMWVVIAIRLEHQWLKTSVRTTQFKLVDGFTSHTHTYKLTHTTRIYTYT